MGLMSNTLGGIKSCAEFWSLPAKQNPTAPTGRVVVVGMRVTGSANTTATTATPFTAVVPEQ